MSTVPVMIVAQQVDGDEHNLWGADASLIHGSACPSAASPCLQALFTPKPCPIGYYQPSAESSACIACQIGTYAHSSGSTNCSYCDVGTFASSTRSRSCTLCSAGTFSDATGTANCSGVVCSRGFYGTAGESSASEAACKPCPLGKYADADARAACAACPSGKYQPNISAVGCLACPDGKHQTTGGQMACEVCPISPTSVG